MKVSFKTQKSVENIDEDGSLKSFNSSLNSISSGRVDKIKKTKNRYEKIEAKFKREREDERKMQAKLSEFLEGMLKHVYFYRCW